MRTLLLLALGSMATAASAQVAGGGVPAPLGTPLSTVRGYTALAPTPTMIRLDQERQARGWAYLNANAHTKGDVIALAAQCHRSTMKPSYCAIPEIQRIAYPSRYR